MRCLSLEVKGYKPLAYGGIDKLTVECFDQINVLTGENGKGKSSVLRELTPYPASRSDYHKNGYKRIEYSHDGKRYELISDFSKSAAHSFLVDGVEHNPGGTAEVQSDLVEQHFGGYSKLVERLVSGGCKYSEMSRGDRKQVFMLTYPTSMEFILEKHKTLSSMIRSGNSQLKLMKERELKLKESSIPDDLLKKQRELKELMSEALNSLDKDAYAMGRAIAPYASSMEQSTIWDELSNVMRDVKLCRDEYNALLSDGYVPISKGNLLSEKTSCEGRISHLQESIDRMLVNGRQQVQEYERLSAMLQGGESDEVLASYTSEAAAQEEIIAAHPDEGMPVISEEQSMWWHDHEGLLDVLKGVIVESGTLWSTEKIAAAQDEYHQLEYSLGETSRSIDRCTSSINALDVRLQRCDSRRYPSTCTMTCSLRDSAKQIEDSLKTEKASLVSDLKKLQSEDTSIRKCLNELKKDLQYRCTTPPILQQFEHYFSNHTWKDFALNGKTLIDALNADMVGIVNRMHRLILYSAGQEEARKATLRLKELRTRIEVLKQTNLPSKKALTEVVSSLKERLDSSANEIKRCKSVQSACQKTLEFVKGHEALCNKVESLTSRFEELSAQLRTTAVVDFVRKELSRMDEVKSSISEKLRDLESSVKEQESIRIRLNDEVLPTMDRIKADLYKWGIIEHELSPVSGLPKRVMTKYINGVFKRANMFIRQVWSYEMELVYLKEDEDCDYVFPVMVNGDGVVKDISICSKGQKEIIDLAIMLAICTCRGYAMRYPIKLDEMSSGLSPEHNSRLFGFLGELFSRDEILQAFIVSHDPIVNNGFDQAGYVALSESSTDLCRVISKIE